ncbi:putative ran-binding protein [Operophtera brumata]|uniref:Putative ran-binding protein n=1 Tax=Operophtera brumata TaxID=104452 RepID=A0A0L7LCD3_OPEBR|nr:putative ran-binding protein [Operophtera brumata]
MTVRVVMRREQVLKICLNHALTSDLVYNSKDEKTWLFAANDFSEGELALQKFCIRFSNKEIAMQFKNAIDNSVQGIPIDVEVEPNSTKSDKKIDDDVVFVSEIQANAEDKQKAIDLRLPENFYTYKNKEPCRGCRGCSDEDAKSDTQPPRTITVSEVAATLAKQNVTQPSLVTPMKTKLPIFQSPTNSVYGTPGNDKTFDTSLFRTPLGSIGSNTVSSTPSNSSSDGIDGNKENVLTKKSNIFCNLGEQRSIFGTPQRPPASFGAGDSQIPVSSKSSLLAPPKLSTLNASSENQAPEVKSIFSSTQAKPAFGEPSIFSGAGISSNKSIFGFAAEKPKNESSPEVKSIFGGNETSVNLFSGTPQGSLFGPGSLTSSNPPKPGASIFGSGGTSIFGSAPVTNTANSETNKFATIWAPIPSDQPVNELPLKLENNLSFAELLTGTDGPPGFEKKADFKWEGTGQQLFTSAQKKDSKNESGAADASDNVEEEFDPHYEPIVPLPDKIVVTTGEEDEEWKERGVGEIKILHHPGKNTYRLLLRREQVHKAVLNMLIHTDIDLLPMKNTETAWTFAGRNFAETATGPYEMLAVRFKNTDLANSFRDSLNQCVRKKEAPAATKKDETEVKETTSFGIAPLRLPKHLPANARADMMFSFKAQPAESSVKANEPWAAATQHALSTTVIKPNGGSKETTPPGGKQVDFQEPEEEQEEEDDEDDDENYEDHEYDQSEYYNEEEAYYTCEGKAVVQQGGEESHCQHATIQVVFDQDFYSPKILVMDSDTGEILADMLIHTDTEFLMNGDSCKWTGTDHTSNEAVDKTVTINFYESESAMQFYDSVETSKHATYTTNDPDPE